MLRQVCSVIGGVAAGPVGSLIGGVTGGLLGAAVETVMPGSSGIVTDALGAFGGEAYQAVGQRVLNGLPSEARSRINHDIQHTFRLAILDALAEIGGQPQAAASKRDPSGTPAEVIFAFETLPAEMRDPMRACLADLARAITSEALFPITAVATSSESAAPYLSQTSLTMLGSSGDDRLTLLLLSELFYDETVGPWLTANSGFYPAELEPLRRHLRRHLLPRALVHFNERIKNPANTEAWRAFNRTLLEELRAGLADLQTGQRALRADQRDLAQKIDQLLQQSATPATLTKYASEMGAVIAAIGASGDAVTASLTNAFNQAVAEQTAFQAVLRDALARIERKLDAIGDTTTRIEDSLGKVQVELERSVPRTHIPWRLAETDVALCPYPGLAVFGTDDAAYFFGRDADIERLVRQTNRPVVAVTGPSGVGKSSFVLAGVLPRLRAQWADLAFVTFRVSTSADLLRDLAVTLAPHAGRASDAIFAELQSSDVALREALLANTAASKIVLVLDQFEELFVGADKGRAADRARLLDSLLEIERRPDPRLLVILTSRENYFEHADYRARPDLRPIVQQRNVPLDGLTDPQLREAILKPLAAFNAQPGRQSSLPIAFENGVIDLIEQEFRRTERTLPLVQYLLRLLWTEQRELSKSAYTTLGGLERALDRHASEIYERFSGDDQRLVRSILLALVRPGIDNRPARRRVPRVDLLGGATRDRVATIITQLSSPNSRIISEQQVGEVNYVELTHEVLLEQWRTLRALIEAYQERLEARERLLPAAEQWQHSLTRTKGRGDSTYLYRGSQLRQAKAYIGAGDMAEGIDTGIRACYHASIRYQRQLIIGSTIGVLATAGLIWFGFNWFTADARARLAAEQLVSSERATAQVVAEQTAQAEAQQRATADVNAAQEAERAKRQAELANAQRLANQARQVFTQGDRSLALALALEANAIEDSPLLAQQVLAEIAYAPGYAGTIGSGSAISRDGTYLLDVQTDGLLLLRNAAEQSEKQIGSISLRNDSAGGIEKPVIQFSADSTRLVVASSQEIRSWNLPDGTLTSQFSFSDADPGPRSISINPYQPTFLMIPSFSSAERNYTNQVQLRDVQTGRILQTLDNDLLSNDSPQVGAFAPDGRHVVVGGGMIGPGAERPIDGTALLWDTQTGEVLGSVSGVSDSLVFGASTLEQDGVLNVAYAGDDDTIHVWTYTGYDKQFFESAALPDARGPLLWSTSNGVLVATKPDKTGIYVWSAAAAPALIPGEGIPLALIADDSQLAVLRGNTLLRLDLRHAAQMMGRITPAGQANYIGVYSILVSPDGGSVLVSDNQTDSTEFYRQSTSNQTRTGLGYGYVIPAGSADRSVAFMSPIPQQSGAIPPNPPPVPVYKVVDMMTGDVRAEVGQTAYGPITSPKYPRPVVSANGQRAVALVPVDRDLTSVVTAFDLRNEQKLSQLGEASTAIANVAISPDGKIALVLLSDSRADYGTMTNGNGPLRLLVWDIESATLLATLDAGVEIQRDMQGFFIEPTALAFSPDGTLFAITVAGGSIRVWETQTLTELWNAPSANEGIRFSPDSRFVVSSGRADAVQLYQARTGAIERTLAEARGPVSFTDSGDLLVSGDAVQQVRIWDVATGSELRRYPLYGDLLSVAVSPDGKRIFTGSADGLKQWRYDSLPDLISWVKANREVANLTCEQRTRYQVQPLCPAGAVATANPQATAPVLSGTRSTVQPTQVTPIPSPAQPPVSNGSTPTPRIDGSVEITPSEVGSDGLFALTSDGFTPNEAVDITVRQPDGVIYDGPFEYTANAAGVVRVEMDYAKVLVNNFTGLWSVTVEGRASGRRTEGRFSFAGFTASPTPGPTLSADQLQGLRPSESGSAEPPQGPFGTSFRITGRGFSPGESVAVTFRFVATDETFDIDGRAADSDGNLQIRILSTSGTGILGTHPAGLWECVFTGSTSQHSVKVYLFVRDV